jgi:DNA-directed RNA polymerase subunit M/transcription elongation factor TFIIS
MKGVNIMSLCPLCNGLRTIHIACPQCNAETEDQGKMMDYVGPYSAYMEIDLLKRNDGFPKSLEKGQCPHIMKCPKCGHDEVVLIQE